MGALVVSLEVSAALAATGEEGGSHHPDPKQGAALGGMWEQSLGSKSIPPPVSAVLSHPITPAALLRTTLSTWHQL